MLIAITILSQGFPHGLNDLCVVGADVKPPGDVDEPLLGRVKVREADTP